MQRMEREREEARLLKLAHNLAKTGRYRSVEEIEASLKLREPGASLSGDKVVRSLIDGTCFRVRRENGLST